MKKINNVFFRVDANRNIGSGHLVRCEIIADNIKSKYPSSSIFFIVKSIPATFENRLNAKGYDVIQIPDSSGNDLQNQLKLLEQYQNTALIVDSDESLYYTKDYQLKIKEVADRLVMITFYNDSHFYADIVHNQNIMAPDLNYSCEPYTKMLLGTKYVVLKDRYKELVKNKYQQADKRIGKTVMLTFGGSDVPDRTGVSFEALQYLQDRISKVIIVLGAMYKHRNKIENSIKNSDLETELYQNTENMPDLMAKCDIALTSGGLTCWEFGVLEVLNIIIPHSKREMLSASYMDRNRYAYSVNNIHDKRNEDLAELIQDILNDDYSKRITKLRKAIDVNGVDKLVKKIIE